MNDLNASDNELALCVLDFDAYIVDALATLAAALLDAGVTGVQTDAVDAPETIWTGVSRIVAPLVDECAHPDVGIVDYCYTEGAVGTLVVEVAFRTATSILTDQVAPAITVFVTNGAEWKIGLSAETARERYEKPE